MFIWFIAFIAICVVNWQFSHLPFTVDQFVVFVHIFVQDAGGEGRVRQNWMHSLRTKKLIFPVGVTLDMDILDVRPDTQISIDFLFFSHPDNHRFWIWSVWNSFIYPWEI